MAEDNAREIRAEVVRRALDESGLSRAQVARDSGLNEATIWGWINGRSIPSPESVARLADALEKRGGALTELARELREAVGE